MAVDTSTRARPEALDAIGSSAPTRAQRHRRFVPVPSLPMPPRSLRQLQPVSSGAVPQAFWLAGSIACRTVRYEGAVALQSTPNRVACGRASLKIARRLVARSGCRSAIPVTFPPGRARLATWPRPTGSAWVANTMGIVFVACRAGSTSVEEVAKIISTFERASSPASSCSSSTRSAQRNSM